MDDSRPQSLTEQDWVQLAAATDAQPLPQGARPRIAVIPVLPGDTVPLPFSDDLRARLGPNGNLAIKSGDLTIILQGYVAADLREPIIIVTSNDRPVDIAAVIAATSPAEIIPTSAGPESGFAIYDSATGNGIFTPFGGTSPFSGLSAAGILDPTQLSYKLIDEDRRFFDTDERGESGENGGGGGGPGIDVEIVPDDDQPVAPDGAFQIDEDFLKDGKQDLPVPSPGDDDGIVIASGAVVADFGADGPRAVDPFVMNDVPGGNGSPSGLFLPDGTPILLQLDAPAGGQQILHGIIAASSIEALRITLDTQTGHFTVTLSGPLLHPSDGTEDNVSLDVGFSVFDKDGSSETTALALSFDDDMPEIETVDAEFALAVDETAIFDPPGVDEDDPIIDNDDGLTAEIEEVDLPSTLTDIGTAIGAATANASGLFSVAFGGDGPSAGSPSFALTVLNAATDLKDTVSGETITLVDKGGGLILGQISGGIVVLALLVEADGQVSMAQYRAIDHGDEEPPPGARDEVAVLGAGFIGVTVTATDGDGDQVSKTVDIGGSITIDDDGPTVGLELVAGAALIVDETVGGLPNDNDETLSPDTKDIGFAALSAGALLTSDIEFGSDKEGGVAFALDLQAGDGTPSGLVDIATHNPVLLFNVGSGIVEGRTNAGAVVFRVTVSAAGDVEVHQFRAIVHPDPNDPDENVSPQVLTAGALALTITATDGDGDSAADRVDLGSIIKFEDDGPLLTTQTITRTVEEDDLDNGQSAGNNEDGSFGNVNVLGNLSNLVKLGSDGPGSRAHFQLDATAISTLPVLTSNGQPVTYTISPNGNVLTASAGGSPVFTLFLSILGNYQFILSDQIDHHPIAAADNIEGFLELDLSGVIRAFDTDGDSIHLSNQFKVLVQDDIPEAVDDPEDVVGLGQAGGNVLSNDISGADDPMAVVSVTGKGGTVIADEDGETIVGEFGTLTISSDGTFSYKAGTGVPAGAVDTFAYVMRDADGDQDTATLSFTYLADTEPPTAGETTAFVDDEGLPGGNPGGTDDIEGEDIIFTGVLPHSAGDFGTTGGLALVGGTGTLGTETVTMVWDPSTNTLTATGPRGVLFTVVIDPLTGEYTLELKDNVLHADGADENNATIDIAFTVTEADGQSATGTLTVDVDDDTPIGSTTALTLDEEGLPGGIPGGPGDAPGEAITTSGTLGASFGADGIGSGFSFANLNGAQTTLGTETVRLSWNATTNTLTGTGPRGPLFTIQLTDLLTGAYTFTLLDNVLHQPGEDENDAVLNLEYAITDADNDTTLANFAITINDDSPVDFSPQAQSLLDAVGSKISGDLDVTDNVGADGLGSVVFIGQNGGANESGVVKALDADGIQLTSGGQPILLTGFGTGQLTGFVDADGDNQVDEGEQVFIATLDPDKDTYDFLIVKMIDNGSGIVFDEASSLHAGHQEWAGFDSDLKNPNSSDLLVTPLDGANGEINTNKSSVGVDNQWIDKNEGVRLDFITGLSGDATTDTSFNFKGRQDIREAAFTITDTQGTGSSGITVRLWDSQTDAFTAGGSLTNFETKQTAVDIYAVAVYHDGILLTAGKDYTVTFDPANPNSATITGLEEGDVVSIAGEELYDRMDVAYTSGSSFVIGDITTVTVGTGTPFDLKYDVQLTDDDEDKSTGQIAIGVEADNADANSFTGGPGDDVVRGGEGADTLSGGAGNDTLVGGPGDDVLNGGLGDDRNIAGQGNDTIDVSQGNDTVLFVSAQDGKDVITGFDVDPVDGEDHIDLDALLDNLGVATAARGSRVSVDDVGADAVVSVDITGNGFDAGDLQITLAGLGDATKLRTGSVGDEHVFLGTL